jgi:hypothetical protein
MQLAQIQAQIGRGEYRVDTQAVAEAIVRRLVAHRKTEAEPERGQRECS